MTGGPARSGGTTGVGSSGSIAAQPQTSRHPIERPGSRGLFVTFEGIEGSGKTTQVALLSARIEASGGSCVVTREPGGTLLGRGLRAVLLDASGVPVSPEAEALLYAADRAQHLVEVIDPALAAGRVVLCDRYLDATLAYQGYGRGLDLRWIRALHGIPPLDRRPVRTILLDLDPGEGLARAHARNHEFDLATTEGRFEREALEFHRRVREGYLDLAAAEPFRWRIVAAEGPADAVAERVADLLSDLVPGIEDDGP